jgi:hypothetical protein
MRRAAALLVGLLAGRLVGAQTTASPAPQATTPHPLAALVTELLVADLDRREVAYREAAKLGPAQLAIVVRRLDHTLTEDESRLPTGALADYAALALAKIGDAGVPALVAALRHQRAGVRGAAAGQVGMAGPRAVEAVPGLTGLIEDDTFVVRIRAAQSLRMLGPAAAPAVPALVAHVAARPAERDFIDALRAIGPAAAPAVPVLIALLADGGSGDGSHADTYSRCAAVEALGAIGEAAAPAVPLLLDTPPATLCYEDPVSRALAAIGAPALPALATALGSDDADRRHLAATALASLATRQLAAVPLLRQALSDPAGAVRAAAVGGLGTIPGLTDADLASIIAALDDPEMEVRAAATGALRQLDRAAGGRPAAREAVAAYEARRLEEAARERAAGVLSRPARAILDLIAGELVPCDNPEEVAAVVFGGLSTDPDEPLPRVGVGTGDLGDGTRAYIFEPPGGSGSWAYRPNYHFVAEDRRLRLIFDGDGVSTGYLTDSPKLNGRYQLVQGWRADGLGGDDDPDIELASGSKVWFWHDGALVEAYTEITVDVAKDPAKLGVTRRWAPGAEALYVAARRTWSHRVGAYDTLSQICQQFATDCAAVIRQNHLRDPDHLEVGRVLRYDSGATP